jgi:hypothetical protein
LWFFHDIKADPELVWVENINPYLIGAPNVLVKSRSKPLHPLTQKMVYGSKPTDRGHLSDISASVADQIRQSDPIAAKYLRKIIGARELLHDEERWCLWLVGAEPSDIRNSPELIQRVTAVREFRLQSTDKMTIADAQKPTEFQKIRQPSTYYIAVPLHSSEDREYVPLALVNSEVIANNAISVIPDGSLRTFGLLMSRVFNVWNQTVSGRLESRTRISGTITYNNFPFPEVAAEQDAQLELASKMVLESREKYPGSSLADLYDSATMPLELRKAHQQLDKSALAAFALKPSATDEEILTELFKLYEAATKGLI